MAHRGRVCVCVCVCVCVRVQGHSLIARFTTIFLLPDFGLRFTKIPVGLITNFIRHPFTSCTCCWMWTSWPIEITMLWPCRLTNHWHHKVIVLSVLSHDSLADEVCAFVRNRVSWCLSNSIQVKHRNVATHLLQCYAKQPGQHVLPEEIPGQAQNIPER